MSRDEGAETRRHCAEQLASIAACRGFDGYLINIESDLVPQAWLPPPLTPLPLPVAHPTRTEGPPTEPPSSSLSLTATTSECPAPVQSLLHFLAELRQALHEKVGPHALVFMYDSISASSGRVEWQNALTDANISFLGSVSWQGEQFNFTGLRSESDGLALNYTWTREDLEKTASRAALEAGRRFDVMVGLDVFGRGAQCYSEGMGCRAGVDLVLAHSLSLFLFAPGLYGIVQLLSLNCFHQKDGLWKNALQSALWTGFRVIENFGKHSRFRE